MNLRVCSQDISPLVFAADKVSVKIEMGYIKGTTREIDKIRNYLGSRQNPDSLFRIGGGIGKKRHPLQMRKRRNPIPLFGGSLAFEPYVEPGIRSSKVTFYLDVNLSRLARYQGDYASPPVLFQTSPVHCPNGEYALQKNADNWLLAGSQTESVSPETLNTFAEGVFTKIRDTLKETLTTARDLASPEAELGWNFGYVLNYAENYVEFLLQNSIGMMDDLKKSLTDFSRDADLTAYPKEFFREKKNGNMPSLIYGIKKGVSLAVYCKTPKRIRFEIRQDPRTSQTLLRRRSTTSIRELVGMLEKLRSDAADELKTVLDFIAQKDGPQSSKVSPIVLITNIAAAVKNAEDALTIVELLRKHGSIDNRSQSERLKRRIRALHRKKLIQSYRKNSGLYQITSENLHALQHFMNYSDSVSSASKPSELNSHHSLITQHRSAA